MALVRITAAGNNALNLVLDTQDNPYLPDGYARVYNEIDAEDLGVIGEIVYELNGLCFHNGQNP